MAPGEKALHGIASRCRSPPFRAPRLSQSSIATAMLLSMFDGLSKSEIIGWVICLVLAVGLTVFGSVYLATSFMSADVSDVLKHPDTDDVRK